MKILYVTTISNTINSFLIPHIEQLIKKGHKVDIACNIKRKIESNLLLENCNIYNIEFQRSPLKIQNYKAYRKIKKLIKNNCYDLIHVHTPIASFITRLSCRNIPNLKIIYTAHGFHFYKGAPLINWILYYPIEKWLSRYTDCLITINNEDYNTAINRRFKAKEIKLVHGVGIDLNKFTPQTSERKDQLRKKYGYKKEDFILFYAAELNYNKHQDLLIKVINILKDKIPNLKLLLAGTGPLKDKYQKMINELNLNSYITLLGLRKDVPNLLALSDIVVASSRREGLPVNIMEAMATGLPVVATDIRGHRDLVSDGINGYLVELDNINNFAEIIENIYKDVELRNKFGKNGVALVKNYSLENILREMALIYKEYLINDI